MNYQRNWTAGQRRKFARNMEFNRSARAIGFALRFAYPVIAVLAFIGFSFWTTHAVAASAAGVSVAMAGGYMRPKALTIGRPEFIGDIALASLPATRQTLNSQNGTLPNDRFIKSLYLVWEGRITNAATNNPTGVQADAPWSLIDSVVIQGTHRVRGRQEIFINVRGPEMRELCGIYRHRFGRTDISANGTLTVNSATGATLTKTLSQTNDIRFELEIPFTPLGVSGGQMVDWLLDAPNYDQLIMYVNFADDQSVFTYGTRGPGVFTAYGSASGSPRCRVYGEFAMFGDAKTPAAGFVPGRVFRDFLELTGSQMTTTATGQRLFNVPRGQVIRNILLKCGTKSAAVASGFSAYNTLVETVLAGNIYVFKGTNKPLRFFQDYRDLFSDAARAYGFNYDVGYGLLDFAKHGSISEALDMRGAIVGATGDVDTYIQSDVTGAANQAALALWEQLFYGPSSGN